MSEDELRKALMRRLRGQETDVVAGAEKVVTLLCGKLQDSKPSDRAVYRVLRSQGLSISEAGNALRLAAVLRTVPYTDLVHRLEPEEGSSRPRKRACTQSSEEKKRKKPKT